MAGDMSLIGPRPIVVEEIERYGDAFRHYCACRPGMTGLWQVSGRNGVDYVRRVKFDEQYATGWSFVLDLIVLCRTVVAGAPRSGAASRSRLGRLLEGRRGTRPCCRPIGSGAPQPR